jgi:hypothetical protein
MDLISQGLEMQIENFNDYRDITSNGFKEMLSLNDRTRAEAKAISKREAQILEDKMFTILEEQTNRINQIAEKSLNS